MYVCIINVSLIYLYSFFILSFAGLETENVCYLLELADIHSANQLSKASLDFISESHNGDFSQIVASSHYERLLEEFPHYKQKLENSCNDLLLSRKYSLSHMSGDSNLMQVCSGGGKDPMKVE